MLNEIESTLFKKFLDKLSDYQGNACCNDYELECTKENYELLQRVLIHNDTVNSHDNDLKAKLKQLDRDYRLKRPLLTYDYMLLDYLRFRAGF